jgi:hypothetical protein
MSRDIFVQDIPASISSVEEIPADWMPEPLPFTPSSVIAAARRHATLDDSDPTWVQVSGAGIDIELNIPDETPFMSFAIHDRSSDRNAGDSFIARVLDDLSARAFDPEGSESGLFEAPSRDA